MASTRTAKAVSFDVCGLDDPKIEFSQKASKSDENVQKPRKYVLGDNGLIEDHTKNGLTNEFRNFPRFARKKSELDASALQVFQVNICL